MDPYIIQCSFQNLLNSQQPNTQFNDSVFASVPRDPYHSVPRQPYHSVPREPYQYVSVSDTSIVSVRKERRKWSLAEDVVLISVWLNTSQDPVVGNEQKAIAFWKRIASYFAATRWGKINEGMCKFVGFYEAETKQRSSGQNEDDVLKMAHTIYFNHYKKKYTLEHAWLELCHDQKWSEASVTKDKVQCKRRKLDDQTAQPSSYVQVNHEEEAMARPVGVKAAKAKGKKTVSKKATLEEEEKERMEFRIIWDIRKADFALKETLNKQKLLDSLIAKTEPLSELKIALKNKLINDMLT
ncbi:hypothetical protein N665_0013s0014 [Sinapis alba]|nr:hypothetical protein N665_0013s0014 [Sinapis alba]